MILYAKNIASIHNLERLLAVAGCVICLFVSVRAWLVLSAEQPMWPLPDLYLLETALAGIAGSWAIFGRAPGQAALRGILIWVVIGVLLAFIVLGGFSIGFFYSPAALCFLIAAAFSTKRQSQSIVVHLSTAVIAAFAQAALMVAAIGFIPHA